MILAKIRYKTHDGKFLAIVKVFKIWKYYLKGCKYNILILNNITIFVGLWIQKA